MDEAKYQALLEALAEVETHQALGELVVRLPELLDPAFARWAEKALSRWESGKAARLRKSLELLAMLREALGQGEARHREKASLGVGARAEAAALLEAIPARIPPSEDPRAAWARPFRQFLALGPKNPEPLQEALRLAQGAREPAIVAWLELVAKERWEQANDEVYQLAAGFHRAGRIEEAYTVLLLPIVLQAVALELADQAPVPRRRALLQEALHSVDKGLELAASLQDKPCAALFFALRGLGLRTLPQLEAAVEAYQHAVAIYRPLAQQQPEYEPGLATTLNNLGAAYDDLRRFEEAVQAFEEALEIYRRLAQQQPKHEPDLATTLNNLGAAYRNLRRFEQAVQAYKQALEIRRRLAQQQPEVYEPDLAATLNNLGNALHNVRRFEQAVQAYKQALEIRRRLAQQQPEYEPGLAMTLNNLGVAYDNLRRFEEALQAYEQALEIRRRLAQQQPKYEPDLAGTLNNLGNALYKVNRFGEALEAYEEALKIHRRLAQQQPEYEPDLATTLNNLGAAYDDLRRFEEAVQAFEQALEIRRRLAQQQPKVYEPDLAGTLSNLGVAYGDLRRFEEAVQAFEEALEIYRRLAQQQPEYEPDLAMTLNNRGNALYKVNRFGEALEAYEEALKIHRRLAQQQPEVYEPDLAGTLNNLGTVLGDLRRFEQAVQAYEQALEIHHRLAQQQPEVYEPDLAMTLNNLGAAYDDLRRFEQAVQAYEQALEIRRRLAQQQPEVYEPDLAGTLNNLGTALRDLRRFEEAVQAYEEALAIYRRHDAPDQQVGVLKNLGTIWYERQDFPNALPYLREAAALAERLRAEGLSPQRRKQIFEEHLPVFEKLLICLMKLHEFDQALEVAERGKSRLLLDLLMAQELRPTQAPPELQQRYQELLFRARALADELERGDPPGTPAQERAQRHKELLAKRQRLNQELEDAHAALRQYAPDFLPAAKPLSREEILQLAQSAGTTIVSLRVTEASSYAFCVFPDGSYQPLEIPQFDLSQLHKFAVEGWMGDYLANRQAWIAAMEQRLATLYTALVAPVHQLLEQKLGDGVHPLLLVPNRALALLPLHACFWEQNGGKRFLADAYVVRYAPSLTLFQRLLQRERGRRELLLAAANPTGDLPFAEYECERIEAAWGAARAQVLWREKATREKVMHGAQVAHLVHLACHGEYRLDAPLESSLALHGAPLKLGEMLEQMNLPQAALVTLSACETALSNPTEQADEHFGLVLGPLYAGARTVWGTLWTVDDVATGLCMGKAYELLRQGKPPAHALRQAQLWLRELTAGEACQLLEAHMEADVEQLAVAAGSRLAKGVALPAQRRLELMEPASRPFAHPFFWAPFQCVGV